MGPRDPVDIAGARPLSDVVVRPLNFTIHSPGARQAPQPPLPWRRSTRPEKTQILMGRFMSAPLTSTLLSGSPSALVGVRGTEFPCRGCRDALGVGAAAPSSASTRRPRSHWLSNESPKCNPWRIDTDGPGRRDSRRGEMVPRETYSSVRAMPPSLSIGPSYTSSRRGSCQPAFALPPSQRWTPWFRLLGRRANLTASLAEPPRLLLALPPPTLALAQGRGFGT